MAGGLGFFAFTTEVAPGGGVKVAAWQKPDGSYIQQLMLVDSDGNPITPQNPLPVSPGNQSGLELHDNSDRSIAGGGSDTHEYTVPANRSLEFSQVLGSSSGNFRVKVEVAVDGINFAELTVRYNDKPPGIDVQFVAKTVPAGGKVRLSCSNRLNQAANLSTTIIGVLYNV